jgi:hypothetical protein
VHSKSSLAGNKKHPAYRLLIASEQGVLHPAIIFEDIIWFFLGNVNMMLEAGVYVNCCNEAICTNIEAIFINVRVLSLRNRLNKPNCTNNVARNSNSVIYLSICLPLQLWREIITPAS